MARDFGQFLWSNGARAHRPLLLIIRFVGIPGVVDTRRLVVGRVLLDKTELQSDEAVFELRVLTKQTERQIKQHVSAQTFECAVHGFLSPSVVDGYRPIIGRVGLSNGDRRELQRRSAEGRIDG